MFMTSLTNQLRSLFVLCFFAVCLASSVRASETQGNPGGPIQLRDGWRMQSLWKVEQTGSAISSPGFADVSWYPVSVPTTVVSSLVKLKHYPDPDFGMNLRQLPGVSYPIGDNFSNFPMRQDSPFMAPWWFRKSFVLPAAYKAKTIWLYFGGINYRANIFLNGKQLG